MRFLRFFILTFGVMLLLTGTLINVTRSPSTIGLWRVVFTHNTGNGWKFIEILPIDRTIEVPTTLTGDLIWSPNNEWVVYATPSTQPTADLYLARPNGSDHRKLKGTIWRPQNIWWSPDSQWIYYFEEIVPGEYNLNRMRIADEHTESFALGSVSAFTCCSWSADGEWLLFMQAPNDKQQNVIRLQPDTLERHIILSLSEQLITVQIGYDYSYPAFFERDGWVYFADRKLFFEVDQIYRMRLDGTERQLIHTTELGGSTLWMSPDGQWITHVSVELGVGSKLERISIDGTRCQTLVEWPWHRSSELSLVHFSDIWSPDGQIILFSTHRLESYHLFQLNIQTGKYHPIYAFDNRNPIKPHFLPISERELDDSLWIIIGLALLAASLMFLIRR